MTDLIFGGSYGPPSGGSVVLDFNAANAAELSIAATLGDVAGDFLVGDFPSVTITTSLGDVLVDVSLEWLAGVFRGPSASVGTGYDDRKDFTELTSQVPYIQGMPTATGPVMPYLYGRGSGAHVGGAWYMPPKHLTDFKGAWQTPPSKTAGLSSQYSAPPSKKLEKSHLWQRSAVAVADLASLYRSPPPLPRERSLNAGPATVTSHGVGLPFGVGSLCYLQHEALAWGEGNPHSWIWGGWILPLQPPVPLYTPSTDLVFYQTQEDYVGGAILVFGNPCYAWPLSYTPPTNLINGVYIVLHTIDVRRLSDNVNVPVESVALQFDIDSWCWSISLNLQTKEIMDLLVSSDGSPVEVRIDLDGNYVTGIIEDYGERRIFGERSYTARGRSSLALFAAPFAPVRSYTEAIQKTAAQLIDYELTGTGWSAAYHASLSQLFTTDWLVPAGAWSYQNKSPIDAIVQIAKAAGGRAYADKAATTVHIDPRYPYSPWNWSTETVDKTIPMSLSRLVNVRLSRQPDYNHIYVSGINQGVLVSATRSGSAGDSPAPMITDSLITYVNAGRERARNVLSNVGRQSRVTLDLPMNATTGLIEPGQLVQVTDAPIWRGLVVGTSISATHGAISQQIEIERHYL